MAVVAVLGLGRMGSRIARRFLAAGHELVVWNRTAARADGLAREGAAAAATPAEAARRADAAVTMLADPDALRAVVEGPDGLAAGVGKGTVVIEMSTVGPRAIEWLASALPAEVDLIDAPVLGSLSEVEAGTLTVFMGGAESAVARWEGLLAALGDTLHVGPLGAGAAAKLVANTTLMGTLGVLGEALALARGLGLEDARVFEVLAATPIAGQAERRRPALDSGDFPLRFALGLARKDMDLVSEAADHAGVELRLAGAVRSWLADAEQERLGERDYSEIVEWIRSQSRTSPAFRSGGKTG
jgi:3-hydroxyisobutyrate dehydrogenase-like beta-hydroxyacid dehydrogenase